MARNEEKQLGKLNRLWLQKEREEGRIRDVNHSRPRLSALNTASNVKKWIPSIKSEINYYLEQSQLSHYSERKIQEFQDKIETLRKEYQSFLWKLRKLDPSCKEHPWKLRGYSRKRAADGKLPSWLESGEHTGAKLLCTPILNQSTNKAQSDSEETPSDGERKPLTVESAMLVLADQDKPLVFNSEKSHPKHIWLRSSYNAGGSETKPMRDILLSKDPAPRGELSAPSLESKQGDLSGGGVKGILGLECYISSEEES
ncbi:uncharacterized protein LOC134568586 isoform X1 [Pelobates fuscus]|uniref:uncharacterized protein LOC134568586 isoform X1 n=1 Tax=Pelobates fuscus TaxID=191477 RepID=UPI002FE4D62A